jgi:hypothetical protein
MTTSGRRRRRHQAREENSDRTNRDAPPSAPRECYAYGRAGASDETGLPLAVCPPACPWTPVEVLDADFWPEV